jgi:uncharacterized protein (TIGR02453 family)
MGTGPNFPRGAVTFLRTLARHNDREWFRAHRDDYDRLLRSPLEAIVNQLDLDFRSFAPELVASPAASIYRIWRDTRFSDDKSPLKTHVAAVFPRRGLPKHQGAGLYLEVGTREVLLGGGIYAPRTSEIHAIRRHIAANFGRFRSIIESPGFRRAVGPVQGERLARLPRGFPTGHPAGEYLRLKQVLAWREYPARLASSPSFYSTVLRVFRAMAPLTTFLNEPLRPSLPDTRATDRFGRS